MAGGRVDRREVVHKGGEVGGGGEGSGDQKGGRYDLMGWPRK